MTFRYDAVFQYLSFAGDVVMLQMGNSELVIYVLVVLLCFMFNFMVQLFTKYKAA